MARGYPSEKRISTIVRPIAAILLLGGTSIAVGLARGLFETYSFQLDLSTLVRGVGAFVLLLILVWLAGIFCCRVRTETHGRKSSFTGKAGEWLASLSPMRAFLLVGISYVVLWMPYYIACLPGNLTSDTVGQIASFCSLANGDGELQILAHHPVFDTLVFGAIVWPFDACGHIRVGIALLTFLQIICTAASMSFALVCAWRRWHAPRRCLVVAWLFTSLCPLVGILVCEISKDSFSCWCFVVFFVCYIECVLKLREGGESGEMGIADKARSETGFPGAPPLHRFPWIAVMIISALLMSLTKQLGIYIAVASLAPLAVVAAVLRRGDLVKGLLGCMACVIVIAAMVAPAAWSALGAVPGHKIEMMSMQVLQLSMAHTRHPEDFTADDRETLSTFVMFDRIATGECNYNPLNVDTIKKNSTATEGLAYVSGPDESTEDYVSFLALWLREGLKRPLDYIEAAATLHSPLFLSGSVSPYFSSNATNWAPGYFQDEELSHVGPAKQLANLLSSAYYNLGQTPLLNNIISQRLYATIIPLLFTVLLLLRGRRNRDLLAIVPIALTFCGLLLSPVLMNTSGEPARYFLPLIFTAPTMICSLRALCQEDERPKNRQ